jgi:hypothetical protein
MFKVEQFTVFSLITMLLSVVEFKQNPWAILSTGNYVFWQGPNLWAHETFNT